MPENLRIAVCGELPTACAALWAFAASAAEAAAVVLAAAEAAVIAGARAVGALRDRVAAAVVSGQVS